MASSDENLEQLKGLCAALVDVDSISRDQIKSPSFVNVVRQAAMNYRATTAKK